MKFFSFTLPLDEWKRWASVLPEPSFQKKLISAEGIKMQIVYEFRYGLATVGNWYGFDRLRRSYKNVINRVVFNDHPSIDGDGWEATGKLYKAHQLQVFPLDEQSYPVIIKWASSKKTFRRSAFIYTKRLKYEGMLTYPAIMAALYALNEKLPSMERIKTRTMEKLASDILERSSGWLEKLSPKELHTVRSELGQRRGQQLQTEKGERIKAIKAEINKGSYVKPSGAINQAKLSESLGLHRNTIRNLLPLALAVLIVIIWIRPSVSLTSFFASSYERAGERKGWQGHHLAKSFCAFFQNSLFYGALKRLRGTLIVRNSLGKVYLCTFAICALFKCTSNHR